MKNISISLTASGTPEKVIAAVTQQTKNHSKDPIAWPVAGALRDAVVKSLASAKPKDPVTVAASVALKFGDGAAPEKKK